MDYTSKILFMRSSVSQSGVKGGSLMFGREDPHIGLPAATMVVNGRGGHLYKNCTMPAASKEKGKMEVGRGGHLYKNGAVPMEVRKEEFGKPLGYKPQRRQTTGSALGKATYFGYSRNYQGGFQTGGPCLSNPPHFN